MRVAFVVPSLGPTEGQGRANLAMLRAVVRAGHQVDVFAGNVPAEARAMANVRPLPRLPAWQFGNQLLALAVTRGLIRRERYDLIHADAAVAGVTADVVVVHTVTARWLDLPAEVWRGSGARGVNEAVATRVKASLELRQARAAKVVAANSAQTADDLVSRGVARERIGILPFGVDADRFTPATPEQRAKARARFAIEPDAFVVAFVGPLGRRKGFDVAVRALEGSGDVLLAVGDHREPELLDAARGIIMRAPGKVDDVRQVYAAADALMYPSAYDGFGMAVLEAMASGLPVLVSEQTGSHTLVGDAGFTAPSSDADAYTDGLESLRRDRDLRRAMGELARDRARKLSWDETGATLLKLYQRI